ncbi:MAG: heat-inducible transcriptional repressor HrcA [Lachnospiraceae bacterium]|nr:heat-inducible transcriptional repressor HrcA [Lachnospiraceae bacterium]
MEELDDRKKKILNVIIDTYLKTGEPVGSRTISKAPGLDLSSATIRNEMSDLEDMGYIESPHTSAGRIPTDQGYRYYVDNLIMDRDREVMEVRTSLTEKTEKMEKVLKKIVQYLAQNTQLPTVISAPSITKNRVKFVQLSAVDEHQLLSVVVMDGNVVRNKMIQVSEPVNNEELLKLNMLLNTTLNGLTVQDINLGLIQKIRGQAGTNSDIIESVLETIADTITEDDLEIYTSGATNIFRYPELADSQKASEFLQKFEDKDDLAELINEAEEDAKETGKGLRVYIGNENPVKNMKDVSVVTATYELGDGVKGTIGIIGPKRMDYQKVMDSLRSLKVQLEGTLRRPGIPGSSDKGNNSGDGPGGSQEE